MTGGEGADRSCGIIEEQYITAPLSRGGDGITVYGSDGPVVIRNCTVDLGRWPLDKLDEGISGVDGARAVIRRTRVTRVGKAILWGLSLIHIYLTQNFSLMSSDPRAVRRVLESIKPDMEALIRRALDKIASDRRRTAYA